MAIYTPGPLAGQISGRLGASIFSHNRGGPYIRNGTIPTKVTSQYATNIKTILAARSAAWQGLTAAQRLEWVEYARQNPIQNRLGLQKTLTGHQAYISINHRLAQAGDTLLSVPPIGGPPDSLTSLSLSLDIGAGDFKASFAATPLAADDRLWLQAAVLPSAGCTYIGNLLKLIKISDKAQATDYDFQADCEARFGALQVNDRITVVASVFDSATGLLSNPLRASGTVSST